jgi:3-hydroxyanthranilate 3,4-dioxygenase
LLKPPVSNKALFEAGGIFVQVAGGPNQRVDFHDDPGDEFFYQLRGDRVLKVIEQGVIRDIRIRAGEVSLLPAHVRHSPQRPVPDSVALVVENERRPGDLDGFEWFCFGCGTLLHRVEITVADTVRDLPLVRRILCERVGPNLPEMREHTSRKGAAARLGDIVGLIRERNALLHRLAFPFDFIA